MEAPSDYGASVIRSVVPVIVALLLGWLVRRGFDIPPETLYGLVEAVVFAAYYSVVRFFEERKERLGWLLGLPRQPHYAPPNIVVETPGQGDAIVPLREDARRGGE